MTKQTLSILLRFALSIILLAVLLTRVDLNHLLDDFRNVDLALFAVGLGVFWVFIAGWAFRWHLLLRDVVADVRYIDAFSTLLSGFFMSLFLPTVVGQDVGRAYELSREREGRGDKVSIVSTVLLDRLVGLISIVLIAVIALLIQGSQYVGSEAIVTIIGVLIALVGGWLLFFNLRFMGHFRPLLRWPAINRLRKTIRELYFALYRLHRKPRLLVYTLLVSIVMSLLEITSVVILSRAIGLSTNPVFFYIFLPIIWIVLTIPISISGFGLRETAFVFLFTQVGVDSSHAISISFLYFAFSAIVGVCGGLLWLRSSVLLVARARTR
ncbi:MAG: hypothetical protein CUN54_08185, partial [Phototrophicales bacterium]